MCPYVAEGQIIVDVAKGIEEATLMTLSQQIECIKCLQHDKTDPNDVSKNPHELTHGPDALRYFAQTYVLPGEREREETEDDEEEGGMDYQTAMCGSGLSRSYIRP